MIETKSIIIILLIILFFANYWIIFYSSPTKAEVESFLEKNSCSPYSIKTDYSSEYQCAYYLRRHTTKLAGQIVNVPIFSFLFVYTPFHYYNTLEHTYVYVDTRDKGVLVYNPVNGEYITRFNNVDEAIESSDKIFDDAIKDRKL